MYSAIEGYELSEIYSYKLATEKPFLGNVISSTTIHSLQ